jgi:HlyD family secretion protein
MRNFRSKSVALVFGSAGLGLAILIATGVYQPGGSPAWSEPQPEAPATSLWAAAAPGRVEPKGRELRIAAPVPAAIKDGLVSADEHVKKGDLLFRLDDGELAARLAAFEAQVAVKLADRDDAKVKGAALDRRKAEDAVYDAEREAFETRMDLDAALADRKLYKASEADVAKARTAVSTAADRVERERQKLSRVEERDLPKLTREEAALAAARAEVTGVSANLERLRVRAPADATVLKVDARAGEMAAAGAPLILLGDSEHMQARAEVEERDVRKVFVGQRAVVKSEAFPDRIFDARVATMAKTLGSPELTSRGPRKHTDVDILEVVLDMDPGGPLLPGMRVDVMFRDAESAEQTSLAKDATTR